MRFILWLFSIACTGILISFALMNKQIVDVRLWPLDIAISAPLYLFTLGALIFGILLGGVLVWLSLLPRWVEIWKLRRHNQSLNTEIEKLRLANQPVVRTKINWKFWEKI